MFEVWRCEALRSTVLSTHDQSRGIWNLVASADDGDEPNFRLEDWAQFAAPMMTGGLIEGEPLREVENPFYERERRPLDGARWLQARCRSQPAPSSFVQPSVPSQARRPVRVSDVVLLVVAVVVLLWWVFTYAL